MTTAPPTVPDSRLPALVAVCELLARAAEPSPLARTVPVVGRLAEGCLGEPADWRSATAAWQHLAQLAETVAADVDGYRRSAGAHWRHPGIEGVDTSVRSAAEELSGVGAVAAAMAGTGADLYELLLEAHLRFITATVRAAARAQLAGGYPEPAERVVHTSAILGEWLAEVLTVVAAALTRCAKLTGSAGPVRPPLQQLSALAQRS